MHIKDHATAQGWFRRHAAAPSSKGSWKAFVARNNRAQEPRTMVQEPRTGFKEGNGVYDEKDLLGKRVRELMDEGYDFGEAVRQAMKEGYAEGGRIGFRYGSSSFDAHTKREAAFKAYKDYKKSYYNSRQRNPIITFREFLPIYAKENFAEGGRIGYANGPPGTIKKATGPTKKNTGSTSPVKTDTHIYKRTNRHGTVWSDTKSKTAEGWKKRKAHALEPKNIEDIRANLVKNKKKVTMVNNQFIFANEKLEKEFIEDMLLKWDHPRTSTAGKAAGVKTTAQLFEKYFKGTYAESGVKNLIFRFKKELGETFRKLPPSEMNAHQKRREVKLLITQAGKRISGLDDFPSHHLYPIGDEFAHGTQDFTILDKKTNSQLSGSNKQLIALTEERTQLVNDAHSGKISSKNFDIEMGKLDKKAQTIIDGHYKEFPKHDGLLNWRKATSILDDQGRFMDIQSTGTIGGDSSKWAITDVNKQIKDLSKTELATFRSDIKNIASEEIKKSFTPESRLKGKKVMVASTLDKFLKSKGEDICG
jgi:hypothetical protein